MGSWNDMGFSDAEVHKQYEELSGVVYETTIWNKVYRMPFIFQPPPHI